MAAALQLAQLATLNPSSPYERYLPGKPDPGDTIQVKFSPNVVRLEIAGPGLPEIAFFDLPGGKLFPISTSCTSVLTA